VAAAGRSPALAKLLAQRAALDEKIASAQRAERGVVIAQIRSLMAQYGLSLNDLGDLGPPAPRAQGAMSVKGRGEGTTTDAMPGRSAVPAAREGRKLGKVAPKYRDQATGQTWSGRGLKPKWLVAALAAGRSLDEFRI
jgi:DNA-binding protein H-NS